MKEPAAAEEEMVLRDYLAYYAAQGAGGELAVCDEASLKARARRLLGPRRRGALDVCSVAERCRRARGERGGSVLRDLLKALEVLELLCVNLLLAPWRKEIRSLKVGKHRGARSGYAASPGEARLAPGPGSLCPRLVAQEARQQRPRPGGLGAALRSPVWAG